MIYDIFISYRRDGGGATAGRINDMLTADGYSVSYDVDTMREGRFDSQLLERIEQCQDFILVVDKNCFVRTVDPTTDPQDDWLWQELSYALKLKKNIIPVLLAGASFPKQLPDDINDVRKIQAPTCIHEYFDSFYSKLKGYLHAHPRLAHYSSQLASAPNSPILKLKTDLDCVFSLDGEETAKLKAGKLSKFPLSEGEYELKFVSEENAKDFVIEDYFEMPHHDKRYDVKLLPIREKRLEQERIEEEARQKAEQERLEQDRLEQERKEAERRAKAEAEKKAKEEAKRKAEEEAARKAKEAEERKRLERERKEREYQVEEEKKKVCRTVPDGLIFNVNGVEFKMVNVEGGSFWMGADNGKYTRTVKGFLGIKKNEKYIDTSVKNYDSDTYGNEYPVHKVTLSEFYIGETAVTQALWRAVMGSEPTALDGWENQYGRGDNYSAYRVTYNDVVNDFLPKLNRLTGKNFRLPTEAEWEYAARGGEKSQGYKYAGSKTIGEVAWYIDNSGGSTHPVKGKKPNELGLYDMSGNVWEWCKDWEDSYSSSDQTNPTGPISGSGRVLRGGGWGSDARLCRVSNRDFHAPDGMSSGIGFRLVLPQ